MFMYEPLIFGGRSLRSYLFFVIDVILAVIFFLIGGPCWIIFFFKFSIPFDFLRVPLVVFALIFEAVFFIFQVVFLLSFIWHNYTYARLNISQIFSCNTIYI